jgi:hypothetical protein
MATHALQLRVRKSDHLYEAHALRALVRRWVPLEDLAHTRSRATSSPPTS